MTELYLLKNLSFRRNLLLFGCIILAFAAQARTITGRVLSDADSTAVAGAVCRLSADGKFINGTEANHDGQFQLETDNKGHLTLEIGFTGYVSTEILIESGAKNIKLGNVYLNEGITLNEVTITGNSLVDSRGRTIIFPSESDVKSSSSSIGLFQKLTLPGLDANPLSRSISVDNGSPVILINGIPASMEEVNAIQPKDILKVEYSRLTPIRYAGSGASGFLNITLKQRNDGGSTYLFGRQAVNHTFLDATTNASYHQGPSQFNIFYTPSWRNNRQTYDESHSSYIGDDFRVNLDATDHNPFNYFTNDLIFKYNFSPTVNTLFSATFKARSLTTKRELFGTTIDSELGEYDNYNLTRNRYFTPSLDLFLHHDFNPKNSLEVQVVGSLNSSHYMRDNHYYIEEAGTGTQDYLTDIDSRRLSLISEVNYTHTFSDKTQLSGGVQNTISRSRNKYLTTDYQPILTENHNYIYARFGQQVGRLWFSLATGLKVYWTNNDDNKRSFVRSLSTLQVSWNISNSWHISGQAQYSPGIPSLTSLTDYAEQITPYLITNGNRDLKASNTFTYQLSPSFQYKKFMAYLSAYYAETYNPVINDVTYLGDKLFLTQSINARKSWNTNATLSLRIADIYGFGASVSLSLSHYETLTDNWNLHLTSLEPTIYLWYTWRKFTISYWQRIPGKYLSGTYVGRSENGNMLSLDYRPNNHWTIGASWWYIFDKNGWYSPSWDYSPVNPSVNKRHIYDNNNMVTLSVTYTTDFGSIFRSAKRRLNNSDTGSSLRQT